MNAIKVTFGAGKTAEELKAFIIGCYFHWKQAVRKYLLETVKFNRDLVTKLIGPGGVLEILTIVPPEEIQSKTIPFVQAKIADIDPLATTDHTAQWAKFWEYFVRIWLNYYETTDWNVYRFYLMHLAGKLTDEQMINRANNPLESWNAVFNNFFAHSPIMTIFIAVIRKCSQDKYNDLIRIQLGQMNRKVRDPPSFPNMPSDYASFVPVPVVAAPAMLAASAVVVATIGAAGAMADPAPAPADAAGAMADPGPAPADAAGAMAGLVPVPVVAAPAMLAASAVVVAPTGAAGAMADPVPAPADAAGAMAGLVPVPAIAAGAIAGEDDDNAPANIAPVPAASSHKQQKQRKQGKSEREKAPKKAALAASSGLNISTDFKPKSYRNPT